MMSSGLAILFSPKDRPRVLDISTLTEMQNAEKQKPGSTWCLVGSPSDLEVAKHGAILLVSVGDLSKTARENERSHYKALTVGHICIGHQNFISDVVVNGPVYRGLDMVVELACRSYAERIYTHFTEQQARELAAETFEAAAQFVDCECVVAHLAAVTGLGFNMGAVQHKPGMMN
jgi:hypothetical protein